MLSFELSKKWITEELSTEDYKAILAYEMSLQNMDDKTVYSIRTTEKRPDEKAKNENYEWSGVPELIY